MTTFLLFLPKYILCTKVIEKKKIIKKLKKKKIYIYIHSVTEFVICRFTVYVSVLCDYKYGFHLLIDLIFYTFWVTDRSGLFLHEGDIELTGWQRKILKKQNSGGRQKRGAMRSLARRWMDSSGRPLIPYYIEGSVGECGRMNRMQNYGYSK